MFKYISELMEEVTELSVDGNPDFGLIDRLNDLAVKNNARLLFGQKCNKITSIYVSFRSDNFEKSSIDFFSEYFENPKKYWESFPLPLLSL